MKLPNFRLDETKATASLVIGLVALLGIAALVVLVFRGFVSGENVIYYNQESGLGRFRPYLVYGATAATCLLGFVAGLLGFVSLGQKRNNKQGHSWAGLATGAVGISFAIVLFFAWRFMSEAAIMEH